MHRKYLKNTNITVCRQNSRKQEWIFILFRQTKRPLWQDLNFQFPLKEVPVLHRRRIKADEKAKVIAAVCVTELIQFLTALAIFTRMIFKKKRINRITAPWRNGCFEKMDDHQVHSIRNYHPTKIDDLPKTFVQIIFAAKWLVRPTATTFAFSFVFILLLLGHNATTHKYSFLYMYI